MTIGTGAEATEGKRVVGESWVGGAAVREVLDCKAQTSPLRHVLEIRTRPRVSHGRSPQLLSRRAAAGLLGTDWILEQAPARAEAPLCGSLQPAALPEGRCLEAVPAHAPLQCTLKPSGRA